MNFQELQKLLFGTTKYDSLINDFRWDDNNLKVWVYVFNIQALLHNFKSVLDGTNYKELIWVGDTICIEHFDEWLPDIDESELFSLFPCD